MSNLLRNVARDVYHFQDAARPQDSTSWVHERRKGEELHRRLAHDKRFVRAQ